MDSFESKYFSYFNILPIYIVLQLNNSPQKNPKEKLYQNSQP